MHKLSRFSIFLLLQCVLVSSLRAQDSGRDSLKLTIGQAEDQFLKSNFQLLLKQYDIQSAQAAVITARLFDNPQISFENGVYNPQSGKIFDLSRNGGQYQAQVAQLFRLAGKRNKNIRLAEAGARLPEYEFADMLRTLRFSLHSDFYKIYYQQRSISVYGKEINSLEEILQIFEQQYAKGNVAQKEVLRIKSQLYTLQGEQSDLYNQMEDLQTDFRQLVGATPGKVFVPVADTTKLNLATISSIPYATLLDSARANRNDLKEARAIIDYTALNLKVQKANAIPDLTVSATYDKQGSYVRNYNGLGIAIPIPLFNRNQGAIKQAKIAQETAGTTARSQEVTVENEVSGSYQTALMLEKYYKGIDPGFDGDFNHLIEEVNNNYRKRNISLLEFLDFYDSYKINSIQMNNLKLNRINSLEEINYITGTPFFN